MSESTVAKLKKAGVFLLINAAVIVFALFALRYPLVAFAVFLLLLLNYVIYMVVKTTNGEATYDDSGIEGEDTENSLKILRFAAAGLALLSWLTTAGGLRSFVFEEAWQALIASFAVQSILLIFSFMLCTFYVKIKTITSLPPRFKRVIVYAMVFFFTVALCFSSSFSYVFMSNNIYSTVRFSDSNIIIEEYLIKESYELKSVNDEIGVRLKNGLESRIMDLSTALESQDQMSLDSIAGEIEQYKLENAVTEYTADIVHEFNDEVREEVFARNNYAAEQELMAVQSAFENYYNNYSNMYLVNYRGLYNDYTSYGEGGGYYDLTGKINECNTLITSLREGANGIENISGSQYINTIRIYRENAASSYMYLQQAAETLKNKFEGLQAIYSSYNSSVESAEQNQVNINQIMTVIYTDNDDMESIQEAVNELTVNRNLILDSGEVDAAALKQISDFIEYLESYKDYVSLKAQLNTFINTELSRTYNIVADRNSEEYGRLRASGGVIHNEENDTYTISSEQWVAERKAHFSVFTQLLKTLPETSILSTSVEGGTEAAQMSAYNVDAVLKAAYSINRDLLEDITDFERAINYFKYDFSAMAVVALMIAVFLDLGAFLVGCFMFTTKYFNKEERTEPVVTAVAVQETDTRE